MPILALFFGTQFLFFNFLWRLIYSIGPCCQSQKIDPFWTCFQTNYKFAQLLKKIHKQCWQRRGQFRKLVKNSIVGGEARVRSLRSLLSVVLKKAVLTILQKMTTQGNGLYGECCIFVATKFLEVPLIVCEIASLLFSLFQRRFGDIRERTKKSFTGN